MLADFAGWLGQGLSIVADVLDPNSSCWAGSGADADLFLAGAVEEMGRSIVGAGHRRLPVVGTAELGRTRVIGVSDLARTET